MCLPCKFEGLPDCHPQRDSALQLCLKHANLILLLGQPLRWDLCSAALKASMCEPQRSGCRWWLEMKTVNAVLRQPSVLAGADLWLQMLC